MKKKYLILPALRQSENTENIFQKTIEGERVDFNILLKGGYYINDYGMIG